MASKRRDFLAGCAAMVAAGGFGVRRAAGADKVPVLGLIFPPLNRGVPEEGVAMYGERLRYVVTGFGVEQMTPEGFDCRHPAHTGGCREARGGRRRGDRADRHFVDFL